MRREAGIDTDSIICPFCGHRDGQLFEVDCGDWVAQCAQCGAIGPGHATSPESALRWFRPSGLSHSVLSFRRETAFGTHHAHVDDLSIENQRLEHELIHLRMLVGRMVDYLPRGSDLHRDAQNATVDGKKCPNSETGGEAREWLCRDC